MRITHRPAVAVLAAVLAFGPLSAHAGGYGGHYGGGHWGGHGYGGWGPGLLLGGLGIGLLIGSQYSGPAYAGTYYPGYVVAEPPPVVYYPAPAPAPRYVPVQPVAPAQPAAPDPVIYPRNGQSPAQTEADRQACNRWATTQQSAMLDASVFQRATFACLDGRGYSVR